MVDVPDCANVDMGLFPLELASGGSDGERAVMVGGWGCGRCTE